jgi:glycosyltransferase domain-containing protein
MIEDLTVCIFTKNRPNNIAKQVDYYRKTNIKLIILDGSEQAAIVQTQPEIRYYHLPEMLVHDRLLYLRNLIYTKYVVLQADDDFHGINGLAMCVNYLNQNQDYCCVQGRYIRIYNKKPFNWLPDYTFQDNLNIDASNGTERVNSYMQSGMHFIYSVIRTDVFLDLTSCLKNITTGVPSMVENAFSMTLGAYGKYSTLPILYSVRGPSFGPVDGIRFEDWETSSPEYKKDFQIFCRNITSLYSEKLDLNYSDAVHLCMTQAGLIKERGRLKQELRSEVSQRREGINGKLKELAINFIFRMKLAWVLPLREITTWKLFKDVIMSRVLFELWQDLRSIRRML